MNEKKVQTLSISSAKKALRAEMKQRLKSLSSSEVHTQSLAIAQALENGLPAHFQKIALFISMPDEVQTDLIDACLQKRQVQRAIPVWDKTNPDLEFVMPAGPDLRQDDSIVMNTNNPCDASLRWHDSLSFVLFETWPTFDA